MKTFYLILLLALTVPGCSHFTKTGRMDRAYYKQIKQVKAAKEKRREDLIDRQRATQPSLRDTPPPLEVQTVHQSPSEGE